MTAGTPYMRTLLVGLLSSSLATNDQASESFIVFSVSIFVVWPRWVFPWFKGLEATKEANRTRPNAAGRVESTQRGSGV